MDLLKQYLSIKYLSKWDWSPDSQFIAYIYDDGGVKQLWVTEVKEGGPGKRVLLGSNVRDFQWLPGTDTLIVLGEDGLQGVSVKDVDALSPKPLFKTRRRISGLSCSPDGSTLAFILGGQTYLYDVKTGWITEPPGASGMISWSPSGKRYAFSSTARGGVRALQVAEMGGKVLWKSGGASVGGVTWLDEEHLVTVRMKDQGRSAQIDLIGLGDQKQKAKHLLDIPGSEKGPLHFARPIPSPDGKKVLLLLENDGYAHHYVLDPVTGEVKQATFGQCEDFGHAGDQAAWWVDSGGFIYSSNKDEVGERHLYKHDLADGTDERIVGLRGTNSVPKVSSSGRIAFLHCDEYRNMDVWVADPSGQNPFQVTFSMPEFFTPEQQFAPEKVSFESAGGLTIDGYLMKPKNIPEGEKVPGLVWVHGGPIRQIRAGWHPLATYALFHGFNQYLVHRGYAVLSVNYRGGIGYGREFRHALFGKMGVDDTADVVNAGKFLKSLPYVDEERVGVWGLSYGGYMTLHCLTQYPDVFRAGVNIAGIWDFGQYTRWAQSRYGGGFSLFKTYLGGEPEESPDLYAQASPVTFAENMTSPLMNLHGTADANVDFEQLDRIVKDCVRLGKVHESLYYPDETHTFTKRETWLDAMPKIERFLDRYLKETER